MKLCSFKEYFDKYRHEFSENHVGIAVIPYLKWKGLIYPILYPVALCSANRMEEKYRKKLEKVDKKKTIAILNAMSKDKETILVSNNATQRRILIEWIRS